MDNIAFYISNPDRLDRKTLYELRMLVGKYPCFDVARLLLLKNLYLLHDEDFGKEMRRAALYLKNRRVLFELMREYGDMSKFAETSETKQSEYVDRTMSLIDAFLGTLPPETLSLEAESAAAVDYVSAYLMKKDDAIEMPKLRCQELIDDFLEKGEDKFVLQLSDDVESTCLYGETGNADKTKEIVAETPVFSETLVNIYLEQEKFDKALEILRRLYLDYPNKNRYFADQIRFLEKIVKHTKRK